MKKLEMAIFNDFSNLQPNVNKSRARFKTIKSFK